MRPKPIIWFERALLLAVAIDLINNVIAIPTMKAGLAMRGMILSPAMVVAAVVVAPALGLVFWYFIARRASVSAKWLMAAFVALAIVIFVRQMIETPLASGNPMLMAAVIAELLKLYAVICLFMPAARPWFYGDEPEFSDEDSEFHEEDPA